MLQSGHHAIYNCKVMSIPSVGLAKYAKLIEIKHQYLDQQKYKQGSTSTYININILIQVQRLKGFLPAQWTQISLSPSVLSRMPWCTSKNGTVECPNPGNMGQGFDYAPQYSPLVRSLDPTCFPRQETYLGLAVYVAEKQPWPCHSSTQFNFEMFCAHSLRL